MERTDFCLFCPTTDGGERTRTHEKRECWKREANGSFMARTKRKLELETHVKSQAVHLAPFPSSARQAVPRLRNDNPKALMIIV